MPEGDWDEYKRLVLSALERVDKQIESLGVKIDTQDSVKAREISNLQVELSMMKVKVALWGVMSSAVTAGVVSAIMAALLRR